MTSTLHVTTRFRRSSRVDDTRVGDRVVLYHRDTGSGVVLNPTGSLVWDALVSPQSAGDLERRLAANFPAIVPERIAADVSSYVESLLANGLIDADS